MQDGYALDYSRTWIELDQKMAEIHKLLLKKSWEEAERVADDMVVASRALRMICFMNREDENELQRTQGSTKNP